MNQAPGQGRFLVPSPQLLVQTLKNRDNDKTLLQLLFDPSLTSSATKDVPQEDYSFLPTQPCNKDCQKPILIGACTVKSESSISEPEPELAPTSSSLSCFNYDNQVFASNKVYFDPFS